MPRRNKPYSRSHAAPASAINKRVQEKRGTAAERGYTSQWTEYSLSFRQQHPYCIACVSLPTESCLVDHIIPVVQGDPTGVGCGQEDPLFWAAWNHQPLCRACHAKKTHHDSAIDAQHRGWVLANLNALNSGTTGVGRDQILARIRLWSSWLVLDASDTIAADLVSTLQCSGQCLVPTG